MDSLVSSKEQALFRTKQKPLLPFELEGEWSQVKRGQVVEFKKQDDAMKIISYKK